MGHSDMHVLFVAVCCLSALTRMRLAAQVTNRTCACSMGSCDFSQVCSPTPNCTRENVALGKPANMSSFWGANEPSGPACLAVNGNTDTIYREKNQANPNCIHTGENDRNAYWLVNLGRNYTIKNITVYIRSGASSRIDLVSITVDDQECYRFSTVTPATPLRKDVTCNPPRRGSVVKLYKNGVNQPEYLLNICEVQVWVCSAGFYGEDCNFPCNSNCRDDISCDNYYGTCLSGCSGRFYGNNCTQACGNCKENATCDFHTGECSNGCKSGWQEPKCNGCKTGFYGHNCNVSCGFCNAMQTCNRENGTCADGCADGYEPPYCIQKCSSGMWGRNCQNPCGACLGWTCRHDNGNCGKGCFSGYEGEHCTVLLQQSSDRDLTGTIVGSVLGAGLLISVSVSAVLIWFRRSTVKDKRCRPPKSKDKETHSTSNDTFAMDNLNFHENVYDRFETQEDEAKPYTVLGKESHATTQGNNYEKLAPQRQNASADSKPYEII